MTDQTTNRERAGTEAWGGLGAAILAISTGAIFARLASSAALVTAAYRMGIASALVLLYALWRHRNQFRELSRRDLLTTALSGVFLAAHFGTWISSLDYTSVANSTVLVNTIPIWVGLLTPLVTRERVPGRLWVSIAVSVAGAVLISAGNLLADEHRALQGDVLALTGGICAAVYLLLGRRVRRRVVLPVYAGVCYGVAAAVLWAVVLGLGLPIRGFPVGTWGALFGMAVISQVIGHSTYNWALRYLSAGVVAVALLGEPVCSSLLAFVLFDESLTGLKLVGCAVTLAGIYLGARARR